MNIKTCQGVEFKEATPALEIIFYIQFAPLITTAAADPGTTYAYTNVMGQTATAVVEQGCLFFVLFHTNGLQLGAYITM